MARKKEEKIKPPWADWDGEYIGNIWGWKFSFISLGIILLMIGLMFWRYHYLGLEGSIFEPPSSKEKQEVPIETKE